MKHTSSYYKYQTKVRLICKLTLLYVSFYEIRVFGIYDKRILKQKKILFWGWGQHIVHRLKYFPNNFFALRDMHGNDSSTKSIIPCGSRYIKYMHEKLKQIKTENANRISETYRKFTCKLV